MHRRTAALTLSLGLTAALAVPSAAVAAGGPGPARPTTSTAPTATATAAPTATPTTTPTGTPTASRTGAAPVVTRGARSARTVLQGTLSAVDAAAGRLTVTVHGGRDKSVRGQDVVVALAPGAVLRQDGAVVTVAALRTGGHVSVQAVRAKDGTLTASRVTVQSGEDSATTAPPTASPTASAPTASPSATATSGS
jgi:hypothetical protein